MMKTILVLAAAMGLSISAASAECVGHKQVNASVDTETKVASVLKQTPAQPAEQTTETEEAVKAD
jgi:hypothetical protein